MIDKVSVIQKRPIPATVCGATQLSNSPSLSKFLISTHSNTVVNKMFLNNRIVGFFLLLIVLDIVR